MLSDMNHARNNKALEIVEEFTSSLKELHANSKPHINMLTLLAEDYIEYAVAIVEAIESHLQKVRSEIKLPVLYLIDSIVKNVNGVYVSHFAKNIVNTFCDVYEKVDENIRAKMWKLRQTWNDVFPVKKLFSLDVRIHNFDPVWPLSTLPPKTANSKSIIHVNPKFFSLQKNAQELQHPVTPHSIKPPVTPQIVNTPVIPQQIRVPVIEPVTETEMQMREELLKKQRELIDLQNQKIQLEMMQRQHKRQTEIRPNNIHVKPELIAADGSLKKPIITPVPSDNSNSLDRQLQSLTYSPPTMIEPKIETVDQKISENGFVDEEQKTNMKNRHSASPVETRESVPTVHSELSLILNDNKCLDNDRIQRSSSSSQKLGVDETRHSSPPARSSSSRTLPSKSWSEGSSSSSYSSPRKRDRQRRHRHRREDRRDSLQKCSRSPDDSDLTRLDTKDLDLRVLPLTANKRQSTDSVEAPHPKKRKDENDFDELFGKEDVDLRVLVKPALSQPPTPPPPIISTDKEGWAKLKIPLKTDSNRGNRDRPNRTKTYNKPIEIDRRRKDCDRNPDRNIEIIMKQAAEQLNQGTITKSQYNKLIQEVLHMSEDQKLKAAQRKERESKVWERYDKNVRIKDHGMHPRPPGGSRWPQPWHQPWVHPPFQNHFRPEFRPWQNHPRLFNNPIRNDFHQFHAGFNPRLNHPLILPNGPVNSMQNGPMNPLAISPGLMLGHLIAKRSNEVDNSAWSSTEVTSSCDEIPPVDLKLYEEIGKDTMKSINIDNVPREIRYYGDTGVIFMHWDDPRDIMFQNGARRITIDGKESIVCSFNEGYREFTYEGEIHKIKLGAPTRELYVDNKWYQCYFGGQPVSVHLKTKKINIKLDGPPPQVKIGTIKRTDLVVGKINLIINARSMVPVFLDAKPQIFDLEGVPCTLEFIDALQTVLLNGRPFKVEFGGLPKPIFLNGLKHFIRFSVLPRGFRAGRVKIIGMRGEQPKESVTEVEWKTPKEPISNQTTSVASPMEPDSTSQDGLLDHAYASKSDLQLDVLSSVVPSAMAPASGLSYQAEPIENTTAPAPTVSLPLNLNELFQRLVETGIVSNLSETKKTEEEEKKEPEIIPVSFDKPETLRIKQPAIISALYSGIQCSSCGARFAPEMATRYSHHLDWHFRQNRKERDASRKAHSRLWYYDISDWIQFEEIEDLEDRAQSWFETEKQNMEIENAMGDELLTETLQPSIPTGSEENSCCQVCHEAFEQFYNDEKEEWHLRPAVSFEEMNFHPLCLEDHKRSLKECVIPMDTSEMSDDKDKFNISIDSSYCIIKTEPNEDKLFDENMEASKSITNEIIETIEKNIDKVSDAIFDSNDEFKLLIKTEINQEADNEIKEINNEASENFLEKTETIQENIEDISIKIETKQENVEYISIKIETKQENVEDVSINIEQDTEKTAVESTLVDTTQVEVQSTIDGNVALESTSFSLGSSQAKIKINIVKPLSPKDSKDNIELTESAEKILNEEKSIPLIPTLIKPTLRDKNLSILPPVNKGEELSALCSIM